MAVSFEKALIDVWRQVLVENVNVVVLETEHFPVRRTPDRHLRHDRISERCRRSSSPGERSCFPTSPHRELWLDCSIIGAANLPMVGKAAPDRGIWLDCAIISSYDTTRVLGLQAGKLAVSLNLVEGT